MSTLAGVINPTCPTMVWKVELPWVNMGTRCRSLLRLPRTPWSSGISPLLISNPGTQLSELSPTSLIVARILVQLATTTNGSVSFLPCTYCNRLTLPLLGRCRLESITLLLEVRRRSPSVVIRWQVRMAWNFLCVSRP